MVHQLQRLRLQRRGAGRPERADDLLLPDVPAIRRRQQDDERPVCLCAVTAASTSSSTAGRPRHGVHLHRQLLPRARRQRAASDGPSCRTTTSPTAPPVAVISSKYLAHALRDRSGVVGKTVRVNNVLVTIVGVLPPEFTGIQQPVGRAARHSVCRSSLEPQLNTIGAASRSGAGDVLVAAGHGTAEAGRDGGAGAGNLEGVFQHTARAGLDSLHEVDVRKPSGRPRGIATGRRFRTLRVEPGNRGIYDVNTTELRSATILSVVVGARAADRLRQRRQPAALARDGAAEGAVGPPVARRHARAVDPAVADREPAARGDRRRARHPRRLLGQAACCLAPPGQAPLLDWRVLAFVLAVTARHRHRVRHRPGASRRPAANVSAALKQTSRSVIGSRSLLGKSLLVVQVAMSLVLLVGAGLFLRTLHNLRQVDVGFNPQNLLLFRVQPSLNRYDEQAHARALPDTARTACGGPRRPRARRSRIRRCSPAASTRRASTSAAGCIRTTRDSGDSINRLVISPNFFEVMDIPSLPGRGFTSRRRRDGAEGRRDQRGGRKEVSFPTRTRSASASGRASRPAGSSRSSASFATPNTTASATPRRRRCTCRICRTVRSVR